MNKVNAQKLLDKKLEEIVQQEKVPTLLLHSCCAPCSSYVLEYLSQYFRITVLYYNPNIEPESEYRKRVEEQKRLIASAPYRYPVSFLEGVYDPQVYHERIRGFEAEPEGGKRCTECFRLRLERTAVTARERGFDFFTTTLSISPLKDAARLNRIGQEMGEKYGISYLMADFKKKDGYKRSIELSAEYGLYRQNYCGCVYSVR